MSREPRYDPWHMRTVLWSTVLAFVLAGCVTKSTHQKTLAEKARLEQELAESRKKPAETEKTLGTRSRSSEASSGRWTEPPRGREQVGKIRRRRSTEKSWRAGGRRSRENDPATSAETILALLTGS